MALKKPAAFYASTLSATISKTLTTIPVADFDDGQGGTLSGTLGFVIDEGENSGSADFGQEVIIGTISGSNLIDCIRGVSNTDGITAVAALQKKHKRGASIKISNHPYVLDIIRALNGETQLDADNIIEYDAAPAFTPGSNELATIKYADDLAIAGSPDASTTTKGISKMSVAPADAAAPIAVGDNDPRVLSADDATLVAAITADAAEINVLDGLTATQSQLNEAGTFFGSTDISAAEAETLTGGAASDADAKHTHNSLVNAFQVTYVYSDSAEISGINLPGGFSDAATPQITGVYGSSGYRSVLFKVAEEISPSVYPADLSTNSLANTVGVLWIGTDIWFSGNTNNIQKNAAGGTFDSQACQGPLGHDPTNSYLLIMNSTTNIRRFSGIAGTALTFVDNITLANAVTATVGFIYEDTNDQYICINTSTNTIYKFSSSGALVSSVTYTFDDTNVKFLALLGSRVYAVIPQAGCSNDTSQPVIGVSTYTFIPTTMTI